MSHPYLLFGEVISKLAVCTVEVVGLVLLEEIEELFLRILVNNLVDIVVDVDFCA